MTFHSILFHDPQDEPVAWKNEPPLFFADLNLDQVSDALFAGREEYDLKPIFYAPLRTGAAIRYRHEVFHDLENPRTFDAIASFAKAMRSVRRQLEAASKLYYQHERERWILDAAALYCEETQRLHEALLGGKIESEGLSAFCKHLGRYLDSPSYVTLAASVTTLRAKLSEIEYCVLVDGNRLTVRNPRGEADLVVSVQETFERFRVGATKSYLLQFADRDGMNHIEAKVLEFVSLLHPEVFVELDRFCKDRASFIDESVRRFGRDVQFYMACIEYSRGLERARLPTCYPSIAEEKSVFARDAFDVALANRLIATNGSVVCNDFYLSGPERVLVVSGPNQGGKTTFARTFGQVQYMAALGCRVAGSAASAYLFDEMFTHFERQEDPTALRGKLEDDVVRIHEILEHATPSSIIILNEIFASTTARDAGILSRRIMDRILALDALCVWVTFIDELASLSEKTVSVVGLVDPANPDVRTFKLERRPADGLAYALSLAEKYRLTYGALHGRLVNGRGG